MQLIETELGELTSKVWETVLGFRLAPSARDAAMEGRREVVIGSIPFTGRWEGVFSVFCPLALAREAAALIFEIDSLSITTAQAAETIGELTNMTAGNLKPLLPQASNMGLPIVTVGDYLTQILPGEELINRSILEYEGQPLEIRLTKRRR